MDHDKYNFADTMMIALASSWAAPGRPRISVPQPAGRTVDGNRGGGQGVAEPVLDAITHGTRPGAFERVTVVVEVKEGCWNRQVLVAMRDQLRDRYLTGGACRHGLHVVGWFSRERWETSDYRRGDARRLIPPTLGEARAHFAAQAEGLSDDHRRIVSLLIDGSPP